MFMGLKMNWVRCIVMTVTIFCNHNILRLSSRKLSSISLSTRDLWKLPRLYYEGSLRSQSEIVLRGDVYHYLVKVMRARDGFYFRIFNPSDGEYLAQILSTSNRNELVTSIQSNIRMMTSTNRSFACTLFFSPIKKSPMKLLLTKSTELGIHQLVPVISGRTVLDGDYNVDTYRKYLIESIEQCERLDVPLLSSPIRFDDWKNWLSNQTHKEDSYHCGATLRQLVKPDLVLIGKERGDVDSVDRRSTIMSALNDYLRIEKTSHFRSIGVMCGPEGGFSDDEWAEMGSLGEICKFVKLSENVLRSETAAIALTSCVVAAWDDHKDLNSKRNL